MKTNSMLTTTRLLAAALCFGSSSAWGAKPVEIIFVNASAAAGGDGASWETAFTDLQVALGAAVSGNQIWVAAGTYTPDPSDRGATFSLKSGVALYGGFASGEKALRERSEDPNLTILSGDIGTIGVETDNSFHVVSADGVTGAIFDGFTVTRGHGDVNSSGAGMNNTNSSLVVSNCIFSHNKVAVGTTSGMGVGRGGGMFNHDSATIVVNCTFSGNQAGNAAWQQTGAGGGMCNWGRFGSVPDVQGPVVIGCTFSDNVASSRGLSEIQYGGGGAIYNTEDCGATIDRCTFLRNLAGSGGAILNYSAMPIITNCIFDTNSLTYSDGYGGAIFNLGGVQILNCTFHQNGWRLFPAGYPPPLFRPNTARGGAICDYRTGSTITNCIFSRNAVKHEGGAVSTAGGATYRGTTLTNCLFFGNTSWQGYPNQSHEVISHVNGGINPLSAGNIYDIDPLLSDPAAGDLHLRFDSPCIDAGYFGKQGNVSWPFGLPDTDFDGDKRVADSDGDGTPAIDIGADEFIPNLSDLGTFLQALADAGAIEPAAAELMLAYVDAARAALDVDDEPTAVRILNELITEARSTLGDNATADLIEMKIRAVIEEI